MQEEPPVIRENTKYDRLIQSIVLVCSMIILGIFIGVQENANNVATKKFVPKTSATEEVENVEFSAGVSKKLLLVMKEQKPEDLVAGVSKRLSQLSQEPIQESHVESLNVNIVTSSVDIKPEKTYKSLDELKISRDMDLTQTTGVSREDFCKLLADFQYDYAGFYKKNAGLIWDLSQEYQVNEIFMCGVFALESYYGSDKRHITSHNYGSIMNGKGKLVKYATDEEGIEANFKLFSNCYLKSDGKYYKGVTLNAISNTYCPPTPDCPSWADKVYACMKYFIED